MAKVGKSITHRCKLTTAPTGDRKTLYLLTTVTGELWVDWEPMMPNAQRKHFTALTRLQALALAKWINEHLKDEPRIVRR